MRPERKLLLAGIILLLAVCAALPFQAGKLRNSEAKTGRDKLVRWRKNAANRPVPLQMHHGESPADDLQEAYERQSPAVLPESPIAEASTGFEELNSPAPPKISSAYRPLLESSNPTPIRAVPAEAARPENREARKLTEPSEIVYHRIRDGDTLQSIAARYLGDSKRYLEIYNLNREKLPSDKVLPLNVVLKVKIDRQGS